jgi:hypothetical protein
MRKVFAFQVFPNLTLLEQDNCSDATCITSRIVLTPDLGNRSLSDCGADMSRYQWAALEFGAFQVTPGRVVARRIALQVTAAAPFVMVAPKNTRFNHPRRLAAATK